MAVNGQVYSSYALQTRFSVKWSRIDTWNYAGGTCGSVLKWELWLHNANEWYTNAIRCNEININGTKVSDGGVWSNYITSGDFKLLEGTTNVQHENNGTKTFNINFSGSFYEEGNVSGNDNFTLDTIPRYANITEFYVKSTDLNNAVIKWNADAWCDAVEYSINNGNWVSTGGLEFTIPNLYPNSSYLIKIRVKNGVSQLWTESNTIIATTKDIARLTNYSNINLGDSLSINYSNPSNADVNVGIYGTDAVTPFATYRATSGGSYIFNFSDEELDKFYKAFGNSNSLNARLYIQTHGNDYYGEYKDIVITLTGNQKTIIIGNNGVRRGKLFIGVNGSVRRGVMWIGDSNNRPRRCI